MIPLRKKQKPCSFSVLCVEKLDTFEYMIDRGKKRKNHYSYPTHNIALKWLDNIGVVIMLAYYFFQY